MSKTDPVQRFLSALVGAVREAFWRLVLVAILGVAAVIGLVWWAF